jgi:sulfopyruvate decarboxylase subunit beta
MNEKRVIECLHRNNIRAITTLPCDRIRRFLSMLYAEPRFELIPLNKEEDGVGICAGIYLGGGRPMMVIQSSGLGNAMNAVMSLAVAYRLPLPILASWRGIYNEGIAAQRPFSKELPAVLAAWGVPHKAILDTADLPLLDDVIQGAFADNTPYVALVSPKVWQDDSFVPPKVFPPRSRESVIHYTSTIQEPEFTRYEAIEIIAEHLNAQAVVSNIGVASKELYSIRDRDLNFYMTGSWGQASPIGFGIALATGRDTLVIDGDGSLLCNSALSVIGARQPKTLFIFCLDNGTHATTGDQMTNAFGRVDMEVYARVMGITNTRKVHTREQLHDALTHLVDGPQFIHVLIQPGNAAVPNIPLPLEEIRTRFREAVHRQIGAPPP